MLTQRKDETVFEYWISFWPVAPMFGVAWRFEKMMPGAAFFRPSAVAAEMAAATAGEAARAAEEAVDATMHAVEPAPAVATADAIEDDGSARAGVETAEALREAAMSNGAAPRPAALYDAPPAEVDDLKRIKGVGPKLETLLNELGVYRLEQIANFSEDDLAWIDAHLTTFRGRPLRDDWPAQARALI